MEQNLTHEQRIILDIQIYGQAFELLKEDGSKERLDPTMVRVIKLTEKPGYKLPPNPEEYYISTTFGEAANSFVKE